MERLTLEQCSDYELMSNEPCFSMAIRELKKYKKADVEGRLVVLPCKLGTTIFRCYNTRGCINCMLKESDCNGIHCPKPKIIEDEFCYEHLSKIDDIYLTRTEARAALERTEEAKTT